MQYYKNFPGVTPRTPMAGGGQAPLLHHPPHGCAVRGGASRPRLRGPRFRVGPPPLKIPGSAPAILLYGTEACVPSNRSLRSFDFYLVRFIMKIFRSNSKDYIHSILENMAFPLPSELFAVRLSNFHLRNCDIDNLFLALTSDKFYNVSCNYTV